MCVCVYKETEMIFPRKMYVFGDINGRREWILAVGSDRSGSLNYSDTQFLLLIYSIIITNIFLFCV